MDTIMTRLTYRQPVICDEEPHAVSTVNVVNLSGSIVSADLAERVSG